MAATYRSSTNQILGQYVDIRRSSYYILDPWGDEINFCCFMCHWTMSLTRCYKTEVFYIYICCFLISVRSLDTTTSAFRKQMDAMWKFYFRFWFSTFYSYRHVIRHRRTKFYPNWTISDIVMMLCRFFKMAIIPSQIYFLFLVLWRLAFRKAKNYLRTKFRPDISIHGRDTTTSSYWKQTSAILKLYSRFRFWPLHRHRYVILHRLTIFCTN